MDKLEFENFENAPLDVSVDDETQKSEEQQAIDFSSGVVAALEQKAKDHNSQCSSKVSISQLKMVYRRGAKETENKGLCAMARVNMFLRMKKNGKITYQQPKIEVSSELKELVFESKSKLKVGTFVDITENWLPIDDDFEQAKADVEKYELNYDFKNVDDLYLDDYKKLDIIWG